MGCLPDRETACVFCELAAHHEKFLYEDELLFVVEDKFPAGQMHLLVIPKVHYWNYRVAPQEYLDHSYAVIRSLLPDVPFRLGYHRFYSIPHLHLHCLLPPYTSWFNWLKSQSPFFIPITS